MPPIRIVLFRLTLLLFVLAMATPTQALATPARQTTPPILLEIPAEMFGLPLAQDAVSAQYAKASVRLQPGDALTFDVDVPIGGEYILLFDAAAAPESDAAPEAELHLDGGFPLPDLRRVVFPLFYHNSTNVFPKDRYGNDALIRQERLTRWSEVPARDLNLSLPVVKS